MAAAPRPEDLCPEPPKPLSPTPRPLSPALYLSSVYMCESPDQADAVLGGRESGYVYARDGHPNADQLADKCRRLHGADRAWICGSGMAALSAALLARCTPSDVVLASSRLYGKTLRLLEKEFSRLGGRCVTADSSDPSAFEAAVEASKPKLVVVETITNPLLRVTDLESIARMCAAAGAQLLVDNTFAGPTLVRPLELGADVVVESLTKIMNGHSDVTLGLLAVRGQAAERCGDVISTWGLASPPFDCWLALRGLSTLALRARESGERARFVAELLSRSKKVSAVHYPGLPSHPDHEILRRLTGVAAPAGPISAGAMVSFTLPGGTPAVEAFIRDSGIPFCPSLADVGTTLSHPASTSHRGWTPAERRAQGIEDGTIRLSVGIESEAFLSSCFSTLTS